MPPKEESIPIDSLSPAELNDVKERVAGDIERLASSSIALQRAANAFEASGHAIASLGDSKEGHPVLLPLTESLYVTGEVADTQNVMVDIGTNYYVEMTCDAGIQYCNRKAEKLRGEIDNLQKVVKGKRNALTQVNLVLQQKLMAQQSQVTKKP